MCILFMYINDNAGPGSYRLILANNRDERYDRPTRPLGFWQSQPHCLSGVDLEPNRGGGTWLGMNRQGKIGILLNVLEPHPPDRTKKSRGHLVNNYLVSDKDAATYLQTVWEERELYSPFNLLTVEKRNGSWCVDYFGSTDGVPPFQIESGLISVSNSPYEKPWNKAVYGKSVFTKIIERQSEIQHRNELVESLFRLMKDNTSHLPDSQLECQSQNYLDADMVRQRSAIFVETPQVRYGTRTHSLILIDDSDNVEFIEQTMRMPVDLTNPQWDTTTLSFRVNPTPT